MPVKAKAKRKVVKKRAACGAKAKKTMKRCGKKK
jgi:hypothetical protein